MAKRKRKSGSKCVPASVAKKGNGRLKKGFKYGKGGCIRRAKGK